MEVSGWLFNTVGGTAVMIFGGMALFALIAFILERRTHKLYFNHDNPKEEKKDELEEWLFQDDDDDWEL